MLPQSDVRGDTVLTVVEEDNPAYALARHDQTKARVFNIHGIGVHALADQELVVAEAANDLLSEGRGTGLELLDLVVAGAAGLEGLLDLLHVSCGIRLGLYSVLQASRSIRTLEVAEVRLLVERGLLEVERVDNVENSLLLVITLVVAALSGGVGTGVEGFTTDGDLAAVGLEDNAVDKLQVEGVGDQLVAANNVLCKSGQLAITIYAVALP